MFKKLLPCLISAFLFCLPALAQVNTLARRSIDNGNWQAGGIFYGESPAKEILGSRTACSKKFDKGDGIIDIIFGGPFHYKDNNGAWQDIDLTIKPATDNYAYHNSSNQFSSFFALNPADGIAINYHNTLITAGINPVVYAPGWSPAVSGNNITVQDNTINYKGIYKDIDLQYEVETSGVASRMVFQNANVFSGLVDQQAITVEETITVPAGAILIDKKGAFQTNRNVEGDLFVTVATDTLYTIPSGRAWDNSFQGRIAETSAEYLPNGVVNVASTIQFISANSFKLISKIPLAWLRAAQYPVSFDPPINIGGAGSFSAGYRYPFNTCRQQRLSQILFLKSDINAGGINTTGNITQIEFFQNTNNPVANNKVKIRMQEVPWTAMTTSMPTTAGFTNVYGPGTQNFTSGGTNTWRSFSLIPFPFTNTENLLIEASFDNSPTSTAGCTCTTTGPGGYWGWYNAPYAGHRWAYSNSAAAPPSGTDCNYSNSPEDNPAYGYFIPATRITINTAAGCAPAVVTSNPSSQSVVAPAQAQFTVSATGTTISYQWQVSTNGGGNWTNVPAAAPYSGSTTATLTINPTNNALNTYQYRCVLSNSCTTPSVNSNAVVLTVNAAGCGTVITPSASPNIPATGGGGTIGINVTPNTCFWSASANASWITTTPPVNGTGDANLVYTVAANSGAARTGNITINGQAYTVNQFGAAAPNTYIISGRVIYQSSAGLPNVVINTSGGTAVTDAQGYYSITVPITYSGTVTATLAPYTFTPSSIAVTPASHTNVNFDATSVSITVTSSVIPPWQREGDDYNGSVTVNIGSTTSNSWHLEADVLDAGNNPVQNGHFSFPYNNSTTITFSTAQSSQLKAASLFGRHVKYTAVFDANNGINSVANTMTEIIEKKWVNKNVVYWRDPTSPDIIKIPTRWSNIAANSPSYLIIKRANATSYLMPFGGTQSDPFSYQFYDNYPLPDALTRYPISIKNNSGNNDFTVDMQTGYCEIKAANSNIYANSVLPGDFKFEIYNSSNALLESGYFDLTKIGRVKGNANSNKVIVIVGGILNESEISADTLRTTNSTSTSSINSYSVIEYLRNELGEYSTWYIAQGNSNKVIRNAYDIGIALERIRKLNNIQTSNPNAEIEIICHSKGGLDVRALISSKNNSAYFNRSFNNEIFSFKDSLISSLVKKVVFLATPHLGAPVENIASILSLNEAVSPGAKDLKTTSAIVLDLKQPDVSLPGNIKYCNVTGFSMYPLFGWGDLVVPEISSLGLSTPTNTKMQLRQLGRTPPLPNFLSHFSIHQNLQLNYIPSFLSQGFMCYSGTTNLVKIKNFIASGDFSQSCNTALSVVTIAGIDFYKSKVSNASVFLKNQDGTFYLTKTDNEGKAIIKTYLPMKSGDSLILDASGVDKIKIPIETTAYLYSFKAVTFKSNIGSDKILYPSFRLINENPLTNKAQIKVEITGQNIKEFFINVHSSETNFIPLSVNNNSSTISLDTGFNKVKIKLVGVDTVVLEKEIFYVPDNYLNTLTRYLSISSPNKYLLARVYVNDNYFNTLDIPTKSFEIFKDDNEIRFSKFGFSDTTYLVDSSQNINLAMQPKNYSSVSDSALLNFNNETNPQYWKTITVKNLSATTNKQVTVKQYDDAFTGMALKPQSRKFVFRKIGSAAPASLKTAIALDQINTPDKDSVYFLYKNGDKWEKYNANVAGVTEYDPEVQKIEFDKLYLQDFAARELVLMQKQRPFMKALDTIWHSGQTIIFPLSNFITDPDSIKNDMTITSGDNKVKCIGNMVYITAPVNFVGTTSFTLTGTHDFLDARKTYVMKVIPPEVYVPTAFTPNRDGLNDILRPYFLGKISYCHFTIFNRGGQKVFDTEDCVSGWDGNIKGTGQQTESFVWILSYQFEGEEKKNAKGTVVLIR